MDLKAEDDLHVFTLNCPYCKSAHLRRSHRRAEDGVGNVLFCKAYRCLDCDQRCFRLSPWRLLGAAALVLTIVLAIAWPA